MFSELDKETVYDVWENGIADAVRLVEDADVIVDCIFGTGFAGELKADAKNPCGSDLRQACYRL